MFSIQSSVSIDLQIGLFITKQSVENIRAFVLTPLPIKTGGK